MLFHSKFSIFFSNKNILKIYTKNAEAFLSISQEYVSLSFTDI